MRDDPILVWKHAGESYCNVPVVDRGFFQRNKGPECDLPAEWELNTTPDAIGLTRVLLVCNRHVRRGLELVATS